MLLLVDKDLFIWHKMSKILMLMSFDSGYNKIVFALLNKLIIFYIKDIII